MDKRFDVKYKVVSSIRECRRDRVTSAIEQDVGDDLLLTEDLAAVRCGVAWWWVEGHELVQGVIGDSGKDYGDRFGNSRSTGCVNGEEGLSMLV